MTPKGMELVKRYRETAERLGFRAILPPAEWATVDMDHIAASQALCHYIGDLERHVRVPSILARQRQVDARNRKRGRR